MPAITDPLPTSIASRDRARVAAPPRLAQRALRRARLLQLLFMLPMLAGAPAIAVAADPEPRDRAALEKQLDSARERLDDAAREVADLTRQLHGDDDLSTLVQRGGQRGAMLGVNIGGEQTRDEGVEIMGVSPSGPAQAAGLRKGDVIMAIDGKPLRRTSATAPSRQLVDHLRTVKPGQAVKLDYVREGKRASATVTTSAAEPPLARLLREHLPGGIPPEFEDFLGGGRGRAFGALELVPVTPKLGQYFGTDKGLLVVRAPATPGLEEGDVILNIDGRVPENPRHAFRILGSYQPAEKLKIDLLRQRKRMTVEIQVPEAPADNSSFRPRAPAAPPAPPPPPGTRPETTSS
jgi:membrane-associated protease RseP (regulator of RpoE activity)